VGPEAIRARRAAACARPVRPFEPIHLSTARWRPDFLKGVDRALARGWRLGSGPLQSLEPPVNWGGVSRSSAVQWHAWWPLDRLFNAHSITGEDRYLTPARGFALDWLARFQTPLLAMDEAQAVEAALSHDETQAWYDMSVGLRLHRLSYLADVAARDVAWSDEEMAELFAAIDFHHRLLAEERLFQGQNNHGVFQALAQLAAAVRLPEGAQARAGGELARRRLAGCLKAHFFDSGVHKEHSPGYHLTLLDTLATAREHGLLQGVDEAWLARAEAALGWMITPTGGLAPFGDTDRAAAARPRGYVARFTDAGLRAAWLGEGQAPEGLMAHADAGYVFARAGQGAAADYLAQHAGYHSRTHKHADHLSLIWHAGGAEVLADPGRYAYAGWTDPGSALRRDGFRYDHPSRVFVETSAAHNVVTVDGRNHDRRARPFGSALKAARAVGDLVLTEAEVVLAKGVRWRRVVVRGAHRFLVVIDHVQAAGREARTLRQHFTLGPEWVEDGELIFRRAGEARALTVVNLALGVAVEPVRRGQDEPTLAGWVAQTPDVLEPACALTLTAKPGRSALFVTLFVLGEAKGAQADIDERSLTGRVSWRDEDGARALDLRRAGWRRRLTPTWIGADPGAESR
jgi:hypothetical protein